MSRSYSYQAAAPIFYVGYEKLPAGSVESFIEKANGQLVTELSRLVELNRGPEAGGWGLKIARHPSGAATIYEVVAPGAEMHQLSNKSPAVLTVWDVLQLSPSDAKKFQMEVWRLIERYRSQSRGKKYLVRVAMAPVRKG